MDPDPGHLDPGHLDPGHLDPASRSELVDHGVVLTPRGRPTRLRDCLLFDLGLLGLLCLAAALGLAVLGRLDAGPAVPVLPEALAALGAGACLVACYVGATARREATAEVVRLGFADLVHYRSWVADQPATAVPEPVRG